MRHAKRHLARSQNRLAPCAGHVFAAAIGDPQHAICVDDERHDQAARVIEVVARVLGPGTHVVGRPEWCPWSDRRNGGGDGGNSNNKEEINGVLNRIQIKEDLVFLAF